MATRKTAAQKAAEAKAAEQAKTATTVEPEAPKEPMENPNVTGTEISVPEGLEPTAGVDTTTEALAKKYGQPVPDNITQVLDDDGNPKPKDGKKKKS